MGSTSEEMSAQADQMQSLVQGCADLIGGQGSREPNSKKKPVRQAAPGRLRETLVSTFTAKMPRRTQIGNGKDLEQSADRADPHDVALHAEAETEDF